MTDNKTNRKLAAIMFADIVSYSRLMGTNEGETLKLLRDFENISAEIVKEYEGVIIKKNGDEIFCEFTSSKNAVDGALKLQKELSKYNDSRPKDFKLEVRIGIHIGDVVKREDGDIHGDGVNVAARIQPLASPGGICVSGAVSDALSSHPDYDVISKGEQELKNILQKHSIFQVKTGYETVEPHGSKPIYARSENNYILYFSITFIAFIGIFLMYNNTFSSSSDQELSIMLAPIKSIEDLKETVIAVYEETEYKEVPDDIELALISDKKLEEIYGEFISYSEANHFSSRMQINNNYIIDEEYKRQGKATPEFTFEAVKILFGSIFGLNNKDFGESLGLLTSDSLSIVNYTTKIAMTDFGYFPVIFRFNSPQYLHYNDYLIWNAIVHNDNGNARLKGEAHITTDDKIVQSMHSALNYKINTSLASSHAYIASINNNQVLIKFNPNDKGSLKERMIYTVDRGYSFPCNDCQSDLDSLVNKRKNELLIFKSSVDRDETSIFNKRFYRKNEAFNSQKELEQLNNETHLLHSLYGQKGNSKMTIGQVSRVKITEVFDSTATATIYKPRNPHSKINAGDYILY